MKLQSNIKLKPNLTTKKKTTEQKNRIIKITAKKQVTQDMEDQFI